MLLVSSLSWQYVYTHDTLQLLGLLADRHGEDDAQPGGGARGGRGRVRLAGRQEGRLLCIVYY